MIYNTRLNGCEKNCLEKMLNPSFKFREEIINQINHAEIIREYTDYYLSIKFILDNTWKCPSDNTGVPVEMRIYKTGESPIQFLLHMSQGIITELEVFKADSSKINKEIPLENAKVEIIINHKWK